jgi:tetratricopeptide (TPR) repeat protein
LSPAPRFPDFIRPTTPPAAASTAAAINADRGWAFLQSGDLKTAEHEFTAALKNDPGFYPAETSLGYLELARKDAKAALPHFDRALEAQTGDVSALVGRGQSLLALGRESDAVAAFEAALAADASLTDVRRRVDVLKFRASEEQIARARQAARSGRFDEAVQAYTAAIAASPDSPFLYREVAAVEKQQNHTDAALEHYRNAVALDPTDARSLIQIGDILDARGEYDKAIQAYAEAAALEPGAEVDRKIEVIRGRAALAKLPAEYRAIEQATQVTRAELAALIGIRLAGLLQAAQRNDATLITDVRNDWAQTWIMAVARAGIIEPFANHQFQPRALVRRADLAQAMAKVAVARRRATAGRRQELGIGAPALQRSCRQPSGVSGRLRRSRGRCIEDRRRQQLPAIASDHRPGGRRRGCQSGGTGQRKMTLTPANQLTLLRMLLIPAFVILVLYGHLGWALFVFTVAGITDGARRSDRAPLRQVFEPRCMARSDGR